MLYKERARHPGRLVYLSVEFANVGCWLTCDDMAVGSGAQFLAAAKYRARYVCNRLPRAGCQSVWAVASQDQVAGGHAGEGVVSLGGAPLAVPTFVTPGFKEFFQLGRALRVTLPLVWREWFIFL